MSSWKPYPAPWREGQCLVLHELFLDRIDGGFYRTWETVGVPKIIFNYRDPRACLTSYVHWLRGGSAIEPTPTQLAYREILRQFSLSEAIMYAIKNPDFPGKRHFRQMRWLLDHPNVLNTRFEDLVGPCGGGKNPQPTLARIGAHLGSARGLEMDPWSSHSPTFRMGSINGWRATWNLGHLGVYAGLHGDVLEAYGYV